MKLLRPTVVFIVSILAISGCAKKQEISTLDRKKAENLVSEAQFAMNVRDVSRAETLLADATRLCPDNGQYWMALGSTRVKLGQKGPARDAYKQSLKAFEDTEREKKNDTESALQQVYLLALLGRIDDARALQAKLLARYPNDRDVRNFVETKQLDRIVADPQFKQMAL